jgi:hypothetical protein
MNLLDQVGGWVAFAVCILDGLYFLVTWLRDYVAKCPYCKSWLCWKSYSQVIGPDCESLCTTSCKACGREHQELVSNW